MLIQLADAFVGELEGTQTPELFPLLSLSQEVSRDVFQAACAKSLPSGALAKEELQAIGCLIGCACSIWPEIDSSGRESFFTDLQPGFAALAAELKRMSF